MSTYLITWNPKRWDWVKLPNLVERIRVGKRAFGSWNVGNNKRIERGDELFLLRQGPHRPGIVARATAKSTFYEGPHFEIDGATAFYVDLEFHELIDYETTKPLDVRHATGILADVHWTTQMSGIRIPDAAAAELRSRWDVHLKDAAILQDGSEYPPNQQLPEEVPGGREYREGSVVTITVNAYERNPLAREKCIERYGVTCVVCGFNFEKAYGRIGRGYIHVHHLKPLHEIGIEYMVDPVNDLRPVCPNCHAMLHRQKETLSIEDLKQTVKRAKVVGA